MATKRRSFSSPAAQGIRSNARITRALRPLGFRWDHQGGNLWHYARKWSDASGWHHDVLVLAEDVHSFPERMSDPVTLITYKVAPKGYITDDPAREAEYGSVTEFLRTDPRRGKAARKRNGRRVVARKFASMPRALIRVVESAKRRIVADAEAGRIPRTAKSWHGMGVDPNEYFIGRDGIPDALRGDTQGESAALAARASENIHQWLRGGGLARALGASKVSVRRRNGSKPRAYRGSDSGKAWMDATPAQGLRGEVGRWLRGCARDNDVVNAVSALRQFPEVTDVVPLSSADGVKMSKGRLMLRVPARRNGSKWHKVS